MDKGNSFSNGPGAGNGDSMGNSAYNGPLIAVMHGELCCCIWCLQGVR